MVSKQTKEESGKASPAPPEPPRRRPDRAAKRAAVEKLTAPTAPVVPDPPPPPPPEKDSIPDLRARLASLQSNHLNLRNIIRSKGEVATGDRLRAEFESAEARFTERLPLLLEGEVDLQGGDEGGRLILLDPATGNEHFVQRIHEMVAKRKPAERENLLQLDAYQFDGKTAFPLERNRAGIRFVPTFEGRSYEAFYVVLIYDRGHRGRVRVLESTVPHFLSLRDAERQHLTRNDEVLEFLARVEEIVEAFVARREQVMFLQREDGGRVKDMYYTQSFSSVEFLIEDNKSKLGVSVKYESPTARLPEHVAVITWGDSAEAAAAIVSAGRKSFGSAMSSRLRKAEDILRKKPLNQAFEEIASLSAAPPPSAQPPPPLPSRSRRVRERGGGGRGEVDAPLAVLGEPVADTSNAIVLFDPAGAPPPEPPAGDLGDVPAGALVVVPMAVEAPAGASARALRAERTAAAKAKSMAMNAAKREKAAARRGAAASKRARTAEVPPPDGPETSVVEVDAIVLMEM